MTSPGVSALVCGSEPFAEPSSHWHQPAPPAPGRPEHPEHSWWTEEPPSRFINSDLSAGDPVRPGSMLWHGLDPSAPHHRARPPPPPPAGAQGLPPQPCSGPSCDSGQAPRQGDPVTSSRACAGALPATSGGRPRPRMGPQPAAQPCGASSPLRQSGGLLPHVNHRRRGGGTDTGKLAPGTGGAAPTWLPPRPAHPGQPGPGALTGRPSGIKGHSGDARARILSALPLCPAGPSSGHTARSAPRALEDAPAGAGQLQGFPWACPPGGSRPADRSLSCPPPPLRELLAAACGPQGTAATLLG